MNNDNSIEIIQPQPSDPPAVRELASLIAKAGDSIIYVEAMGKSMTAKEYFAIMIWDLLTVGQAITAEGIPLQIDKTVDWLSLAKFVSSHLDGVAGRDGGAAGNTFKIYIGIDASRV